MYQFPDIKKHESLIHGFSTKNEGDMAFGKDSGEMIIANRKTLLRKVGIPLKKTVSCKVEHGNKIISVVKSDGGMGLMSPSDELVCDCLITEEKGIYLFLKIADCAPVIFYDPMGKKLALAHFGWKNVDQKFVEKIVKYFKNSFKTDVKNLQIFIGPCARAASYVVENPSQKTDRKWKGFLNSVGENNYEVDFVGLLKSQALKVGISADNLHDCLINTVTDSNFFSHYRFLHGSGEEDGRFACVIGMV